MNYNKTEKEKYRQIWETIDYTSGNAVQFADTVHEIIKQDNIVPADNCFILEIGCGNGITMLRLNEHGYRPYGMDITLAGIKLIDENRVFECPVWDLGNYIKTGLNEDYKFFGFPFYDYTISTDVLEHIPPEMIDQSIENILAVTTYKTIHTIFTRPDTLYCGHEVHLTVKPIDWWQRQFDRLNKKGVEVVLFARD